MTEEMRLRTKPCKNNHPLERSIWVPRLSRFNCRDCKLEAAARWKKSNPDQHATAVREKRRALRLVMIEAYGGRCVCCGISDYRKLTIDHIDGSGHENRRGPYRERESATTQMLRLRDQGWPQANHQLLCWSCNSVKHFYPEQECCPGSQRRMGAPLSAKERRRQRGGAPRR
jgi:5-methylcytosine-specific restriction endonuclease McrA